MKSFKLDTLDNIQRVDDIALLRLVICHWYKRIGWKDEIWIRTKGLAHLPTLRIPNQTMAVNFFEWDLSCELER